jgi:hypothetical protein
MAELGGGGGGKKKGGKVRARKDLYKNRHDAHGGLGVLASDILCHDHNT